MGGLSLRERAGQVIVASYGGTAAPTDLVRRLHLGGVVAFSENIAGAAQAAAQQPGPAALRGAATAGAGRCWSASTRRAAGSPGVTSGVTGFPAFMTAGAAGDPALTREAYAASGAELLGLGFTLDFAPDSDVTVGPSDPAIGARSAGSSPERVAAQVTAAVQGLRVVRPAAGRQALPGPRLGDHRQPLRAARPAPVAGRAAGPRTWCRSARRSTPARPR